MQPCPSNMIRHTFPDHHQLQLQAPVSFDATPSGPADNFLDHLLASLPSGQWPDLAGASVAELAGHAGVAVTDQTQMLLLDGAAGEFLEGGYRNGAAAGDLSSFSSFPDQGQAGGTFTGQSPVPGAATGVPAQPKKKVRARRGQATDPHSIAERLRRVKISERMKALQELVPNTNKTDKASMLDEIIEYVKFLQVQVKLLSASRLGGASGAVAPSSGADIPSQECGGSFTATGRQHNGDPTSSDGSSLTATEQRVAKLMEEDMGSAMQYLQGKGLCLMPISLAATISTATGGRGAALSTAGSGQSSPGISMLTV